MARPASSGPAAVVVDPVGCNGVHEYDDQDHSMVTVEDIAGGAATTSGRSTWVPAAVAGAARWLGCGDDHPPSTVPLEVRRWQPRSS